MGNTTKNAAIIRDQLEQVELKPHPGPAPVRRSRSFFRILGQAVRMLVATVAGVALAAFIVVRVYERVFVSEPSGTAYISSDAIVLSAPTSGQVTYLNAVAGKGEPAFTVLGDDGRTLSVDMPCDCRMMDPVAVEGTRVRSGMPVGEVIPKDPAIYVAATIDGDALLTLYKYPQVAVTFVDGETVPATIRTLPRISNVVSGRSGEVQVTLDPGRELTAAEIGEPVKVTFDTFPLFMRAWKNRLSALNFDFLREPVAADSTGTNDLATNLRSP
jgi:alginate biosynthesis protein Alg44